MSICDEKNTCKALSQPNYCMVSYCTCRSKFQVRLGVWVCDHHNLPVAVKK